jgi:hypothetical protein
MPELGPWPEPASDDAWSAAQAGLALGATVRGIVLNHRPFGFFVTLDDCPAVPGLVQITDYRPGGVLPRYGVDGIFDPPYPAVGTVVTAEVIWLRESNRQVMLRFIE